MKIWEKKIQTFKLHFNWFRWFFFAFEYTKFSIIPIFHFKTQCISFPFDMWLMMQLQFGPRLTEHTHISYRSDKEEELIADNFLEIFSTILLFPIQNIRLASREFSKRYRNVISNATTRRFFFHQLVSLWALFHSNNQNGHFEFSFLFFFSFEEISTIGLFHNRILSMSLLQSWSNQ